MTDAPQSDQISIYEIVNPSDPYTIEGNIRACVLAVTLLGRGWYGLTDSQGDSAMPIMALGGGDDWTQERFGETLQEIMDSTPNEKIAAALDTVLIGSLAERTTMMAVLDAISDPADRERARAAWHDKQRSSLNDIGARAKAIARVLRTNSEVADESAGSTNRREV